MPAPRRPVRYFCATKLVMVEWVSPSSTKGTNNGQAWDKTDSSPRPDSAKVARIRAS